jgi:hypothetical protein
MKQTELAGTQISQEYRFPFGEPVRSLTQIDRSPKPVFVLGVYASAVHAKWLCDGATVCQALAVASEPYIFWDGNPDEASEIISRIKIPSAVGKLTIPNKNLNGPSSKVLIDNILKPLSLTRHDAWLCDLLPESRLNPNQLSVIQTRYNPLIDLYGLNEVTVPAETGQFCDDNRCLELIQEIIESQADTLILLGDMPIKQFLSQICTLGFKNLQEYTRKYAYGQPIKLPIGGRPMNVIPIAHPRQIGGLGHSSDFWKQEHQNWEQKCFANEKMII